MGLATAQVATAIVRAVDTTALTASVQLGPSPTLLPGVRYARHLAHPLVGDHVLLILPQDRPAEAAIIANFTSAPTI